MKLSPIRYARSGDVNVAYQMSLIASRIGAKATADEVLASSSVRDLCAGSGIRFEDRGTHALKGVDRERQLFAAVD